MPKRIQIRRVKGWRKPEGAVYVGRPTKFGNPFVLAHIVNKPFSGMLNGDRKALRDAFANWIFAPERFTLRGEVQRELRGKDLICHCPLDQPCHADVLLEIANA